MKAVDERAGDMQTEDKQTKEQIKEQIEGEGTAEQRVNEKKEPVDRFCMFTTLLCLAPILLGICLYNRLPAQIPSRFDFDGNISGYMNKAAMVFLMPVFMAVMNVVCHVSLNADPGKKNYPPVMKHILQWLLPVLIWVCYPVSLLSGLGMKFSVPAISIMLVSLLLIIVGNYLPKCRRNFTMGIRTPWTLSSEENWRKTHRMAGYLWTAGGLCLLLSGVFLKARMISFIILMFLVMIPCFYSYYLHRKGI